MRLKLPHALHYPITVGSLLKQPGEPIERSDPLFTYTYEAVSTGTEEDGTPFTYKDKFTSRFESSVDGTLQQWLLREGDVVSGRGQDVAEIEEPCTHDVQYGGMCVTCGKDMTNRSYATTQMDTARANINMIHDNAALTVSQGEATRVEMEAKRRLIASRKLSLVVDLDQTIIHATVDPTVAEWQRDPENPNHEAVKDVRAFQLVDEGPGGRGTWYYIKLRPGLKQFLERVSEVYELHIYTMGTRAYAQNIANLVDPQRKIFGDRILSRDESGSMVAKNLQRLFPVDTKMVVIIDDRGDVWNWNANLIKVTPFSFFIGIGDINSSFLPKKPKPPPMPKETTEQPAVTNGTENEGEEKSDNGQKEPTDEEDAKKPEEASPPSVPQVLGVDVSALEQLVAMGGGDNPAVLQEQNAKQDEELAAQLQERPLLQKQKELEAEAEDESDSDSERPRHHLLNDDDTELFFLERSLKRVHTAFFDAHARTLADHGGGRLAALRGAADNKTKRASADMDLELIPDIKQVMPQVKSRVLAGVTIVFSGIIPLGTDPNMAEIVIHARSFGARVSEVVSRRNTTHVVAVRNRTAKVKQAVRRGKGAIKVVGIRWLIDCIVQWEKLDESPYLLRLDEADHGRLAGEDPEDDEALSQSDSHPSGIDDTEAEMTDAADAQVLQAQSHMSKASGPASAGLGKLSLRTDFESDGDDEAGEDDEDLDVRLPAVLANPNSPVGGSGQDWSEMHNEMEEFLGSEADDSDSEDEALDEAVRNGAAAAKNSLLQIPPAARTKRSHADMTGSDSDASVASNRSSRSGTRSPRRKKVAFAAVAAGRSRLAENGGLPTPAITAEGEEGGGAGGAEDMEASDHGWDDFDEAELEAELGRELETDDGA